MKLGVPIGLALLFLMAVGPALPWRAASGEVLRDRLLIPAWIGGLTLVVCVLARRDAASPNVLAFALGAFVLASVARSVIVGVRARARATSERVPVATVRTVRGNPRLYGGLLVHVGVVVLAIGAGHDRRATRPSARCGSRPVSRRRCAASRSRTCARRSRRRAQKTTIERRRARSAGARRTSARLLARRSRRIPNFPDGIGTPRDPHRSVARRLPHARVGAAHGGGASGRDHVRRAGRHVRDVALGRRRDHGARHAARAHADAPAPSRSSRARPPRPTSRARWRRSRRERARTGSAWIALTRRRCVLVAFGVVLAVQHRSEASVPRLVQEHKPVPNVRPRRRSTASRQRPRRSRARPTS